MKYVSFVNAKIACSLSRWPTATDGVRTKGMLVLPAVDGASVVWTETRPYSRSETAVQRKHSPM
jgi:hypothetical protein